MANLNNEGTDLSRFPNYVNELAKFLTVLFALLCICLLFSLGVISTAVMTAGLIIQEYSNCDVCSIFTSIAFSKA